MAVLSLQPCIRKGPNWPVFRFFGAISDFNAGFPQWRGLAETLDFRTEKGKRFSLSGKQRLSNFVV